jgi:hypothetical protein
MAGRYTTTLFLLMKPNLRDKGSASLTLRRYANTGLLLFDDNATTYTEKHAICMYPFLLAMRNVNASLIFQVCEELTEHYGENSDDLKDQFTWMRVFFEKTTTISPEERQTSWEVFIMFGIDKLWEESSLAQQMLAKGEAKGEVKGELKAARASVETLVNARFPDLSELARQKVASMTQSHALNTLLAQIGTAPDENAARRLLLPQEPS